MTFWYLSFAEDRPGGFLGSTVVEGRTAEEAYFVATLLGLNPGGEVAILEIPREGENEPDMLAMKNRLIGREEAIALGGKRVGDLPEEVQEIWEAEAEIICDDCNPAKVLKP